MDPNERGLDDERDSSPDTSTSDQSIAIPTAGQRPRKLEKGFFALAWPALVENLLMTLMGVVSMMMVGRLGPVAVAGVGAANVVMNLLLVVFSGLAVGTTALVARRVGQGNREGAREAIRQSIVIGVGASLFLAAFGVIFAQPILQMMGAEAMVASDGALYLTGLMATIPLLVLWLIGNGGLRGSGDTRTPMIITSIANVANVLVAYPLIFGAFGLPQLGILGATWGIIIARIIGTTLILRSLLLSSGYRQESFLSFFRVDEKVLRPLLAIGGPAAIENGSVQLGFMLFSLIIIRLGTEAFAAQQIVFNVANLSMMPGMAFSIAATTLVGQALGAGDQKLAEISGWRGTISAAIWMTVMGALFIFFAAPIMTLYTSDPQVLEIGKQGLQVLGYGQPFQGIAFVLAGALRGAGDTKTTLTVGSASMWAMRLPIAFFGGLYFGLGAQAIWLGWLADWLVRSTWYAIIFRRGKWKEKRL